MVLSKRLRDLRIQRQVTQKQLAKELNVSRSTIAGYETKNRQPSYEKLAAIAKYFDVSVDYLLGEEQTVLTPLSEHSQEQELLAIFRRLNDSSKKAAQDYLHFLESKEHAES